jgi:hypothetical protein
VLSVCLPSNRGAMSDSSISQIGDGINRQFRHNSVPLSASR